MEKGVRERFEGLMVPKMLKSLSIDSKIYFPLPLKT